VKPGAKFNPSKMKITVVITQQVGEKRSQKKEIFREEFTSEFIAWGTFTDKVRGYCNFGFGATNPVSVTMKDYFGTVYATFQTR
jgi:hypothetical protein